MPSKPRNFYEEANRVDAGTPVDDEVERRLRHRQLQRRIMAAQDEVLAALGDQKHLYMPLEDLLGQRNEAREEAMFNLGFERGLQQGRMDSLALLWKNRESMALAARAAAVLTLHAEAVSREGAAALLEIAWSLLVAGDRLGPAAERA